MKTNNASKMRVYCEMAFAAADPTFKGNYVLIPRSKTYYDARARYGKKVVDHKRATAPEDKKYELDEFKATEKFGAVIEQVQVASYLEYENFDTFVDDQIRDYGKSDDVDVEVLNLKKVVIIDVKSKLDNSCDFVKRTGKEYEWWVKVPPIWKSRNADFYVFCNKETKDDDDHYTKIAGYLSRSEVTKLPKGKYSGHTVTEKDIKPISGLVDYLNTLR